MVGVHAKSATINVFPVGVESGMGPELGSLLESSVAEELAFESGEVAAFFGFFAPFELRSSPEWLLGMPDEVLVPERLLLLDFFVRFVLRKLELRSKPLRTLSGDDALCSDSPEEGASFPPLGDEGEEG